MGGAEGLCGGGGGGSGGWGSPGGTRRAEFNRVRGLGAVAAGKGPRGGLRELDWPRRGTTRGGVRAGLLLS